MKQFLTTLISSTKVQEEEEEEEVQNETLIKITHTKYIRLSSGRGSRCWYTWWPRDEHHELLSITNRPPIIPIDIAVVGMNKNITCLSGHVQEAILETSATVTGSTPVCPEESLWLGRHRQAIWRISDRLCL